MDKPPAALVGLPFKEAAWVRLFKDIKIETYTYQLS